MAKVIPREKRTERTDLLLIGFRILLAIPVCVSLPCSHGLYGELHPSGGLNAMGLLIALPFYGAIGAFIFILVGSIFHYFLRFRNWKLTVKVDLVLAVIVGSYLAYAGASVRYVDIGPTQMVPKISSATTAPKVADPH